MTFPGAGAQIYRNDAGEPLSWDYPQYDEGPDPDDFDVYDDEPDEDDEEWEDDGNEPDVHDPAHETSAPPADSNELAQRLTASLEGQGLKLRYYGDGVINVTTPDRETTPSDVESVRAMLRECGYVEVESWVATQGMSWLSDGVFAGVSFRVRPAGDPA